MEVIEGGKGGEARRPDRWFRKTRRSRRGRPESSERRKPAVGRYRYGAKEGNQVAGFEEEQPRRPVSSRRRRKILRKREGTFHARNKNVPRELRGLSEAEKKRSWERGIEALREAWLNAWIADWEWVLEPGPWYPLAGWFEAKDDPQKAIRGEEADQ